MSDTEQVWELMKKIGICMLVSWDGKELEARPMGAYVRPDEHAVFFLADVRHHKDEDIRKYRKVCLAFADTGAQNYVSVAGDAEILDDRSMIRELWGIPAKAWWNSPDDPNIRLLKVTPHAFCPPDIDPAIKAPTPNAGKTPVIPPPGSPGGDQTVQPK
jgi:general stress protein 26